MKKINQKKEKALKRNIVEKGKKIYLILVNKKKKKFMKKNLKE